MDNSHTMEGESVSSELTQRIAQSAAPVVVVSGPAASGKTTAVLDIYHRHLRPEGTSSCVILVPNASSAEHLRRQMLARSTSGAVAQPNVLTFSAFAGRVLARSGMTARRLSPMQRHLLLQRLVRELHSQGKLSTLSSVADAPGLVTALDRAIAELKRGAIDPEVLATTVTETQGKAADLLTVYQQYQQELLAADLYDVEGQMWLARESLASDPDSLQQVLGDTQVIAIDGFTDFTPTQLEILRLVSLHVQKLVITLPLHNDNRHRLWYWSRQTLDNIRQTFAHRMEVIGVSPQQTAPLADLLDRVFDLQAPACPLPSQIDLIATAGIEAEVSAVARRIKRLLLNGQPAGSIAVLTRNRPTYGPVIQRVFAQHEIPVSPPQTPLTELPIIRFVLDVALVGPNFLYTHVLRVIKNSYFRPQALGSFDRHTIAIAEMIIRQGNVLESRPSYQNAVQTFFQKATQTTGNEQEDSDEDRTLSLGPLPATSEQIQQAGQMLEALFQLAETAKTDLLKIADVLQVQQAACDQDDPIRIARDLRALEALANALRDVPDIPQSVPALREALTLANNPAPRTESLVDFCDVLDARPLRYQHVFLLGVNEGTFPSRQGESPLLSESLRQSWNAKGIHLDSRGDLAAREMLLFYLAASRADNRLTISYLTSNAGGQVQGESNFLTSLLEPAGGIKQARQEGRFEEIPLGSFLPSPEELTRKQDIITAAVCSSFGQIEAPGAIAWTRQHAIEQVHRSARGIYARCRRWATGTCDSFDGHVKDPSLLETLCKRYPERVIFSPSRLGTFGMCPWQYFARYVLKLSPLPQPQEQLEPSTRGEFVHNVLFDMMTALHNQCDGPINLHEVAAETLLEQLDLAVTRESQKIAWKAPYPALWEIQRNQLHSELKRYIFELKKNLLDGQQAAYFELSFGMDCSGEDCDAHSIPQAVVYETPSGNVQLRGRIDRVDLIGDDGDAQLYIVDYKTGQLPSDKDILEGRNLQLPLYIEAAQKVLSNQATGGMFQRISSSSGKKQFVFSQDKHSKGIAQIGGYDEAIKEVRQVVGKFISNLRQGRFDLLPTHKCPSYCPYRQICHFSPARAEVKHSREAAQ